MVKRLLGLCSALALLSILAVSTILAGGGDAPPVPDAPAVQAQELQVEPPMTEIGVEPEPEFFQMGACGPECTTHEDCDGFCGGFGVCSTWPRCKGRCLCGY